MVGRLLSRFRHIFLTEKLVIRSKGPRPLRKNKDFVIRVQVISSRKPTQEILTTLWNEISTNPRMAEASDTSSMTMKPPSSVRGMKTLDREAFKMTAQVPCFKVPNAQIHKTLKQFKKRMVTIPGVKPIAALDQSDPEKGSHKMVLLNPESVPSKESLTADETEFLKTCDVDMESFRTYELSLSYENWRYGEILGAILPEGCDGVGGFSQIGHIIHLNLRDEILEYKNIIGEVLLDKVPSARTVVNKVGTIDTVFRYFAMELLAGEDDTVATTIEWGVSYKFDFSKVYWNPRLSTEHKRVVDDLQRGDIAYDVFAGVGPFAVPAAKKGITVLANDLNPESFKWLKENAQQKLKAPLRTFNMDGRDFIRDVVKPDLLQRWQGIHPDQKAQENTVLNGISFFMNLPDLAIEFLDVFPGLFRDVDLDSLDHLKLPRVYCYCFSKSESPEKDAKERAEAVLGCPLGDDHNIRIVRNVAPNKDMLCVVFTLTKETLFQKVTTDSEPPEKTPKTS